VVNSRLSSSNIPYNVLMILLNITKDIHIKLTYDNLLWDTF
jgi:hypothetical protein